MDYEKEYKSLVAKVKKAHQFAQTDSTKSVLEDILPDLRESEDERILWMIENTLRDAVLSERISETAYREMSAYLEKQKEQKPVEWNDDWREEDIQTRFAFYTYKDDPSVLYLSNVFVEETSRNHGFGTRILKAAEKVAEAIGAVTICLKVKQYSPANAWYRKRGYGFVAFEDGYDWLEKNLEYLKPAKSAEWSEEDKDKVAQYLHDKDGGMLWSKATEITRDILEMLRPQPHWKPSQEQMKVLERFVDYLHESSNKDYEIMDSFLEQLKKL